MLRLFAYLDEYKMYSISSQIFEGLTDSIVQFSTRSSHQTEEQRGPISSGRVLADIATEESGKQERKFLHDYAYTLFEKKLLEDGVVLSIDESNLASVQVAEQPLSLVKVTGKAVFHDMKSVSRTLAELNKLSRAFREVTEGGSGATELALLKAALAGAKGQQKQTLRKRVSERERQLEGENALEPRFVEHLQYLLDYGFEDQLELHIGLPGEGGKETLFSAILDRQYLREPETVLIKKYSRHTEKAFTLFGAITQSTKIVESPDSDNAPPPQGGSIKAATAEVVRRLTVLEDQFVGRLPNEIIIDPIAVYREV